VEDFHKELTRTAVSRSKQSHCLHCFIWRAFTVWLLQHKRNT